jgi:hypothetical protein
MNTFRIKKPVLTDRSNRTKAHHKINEFVQSGKRTVNQLFDFTDFPGLAAWIGDRVNRGFWEIQGVRPNGGGCDEQGLNTELGKQIIENHSKREINVIKQSKTYKLVE